MIRKLGDLQRRLKRLEEATPPGRLLMLCQWEDESHEAALARHHLEPGKNDLSLYAGLRRGYHVYMRPRDPHMEQGGGVDGHTF
jgi:hypothetical protein